MLSVERVVMGACLRLVAPGRISGVDRLSFVNTISEL